MLVFYVANLCCLKKFKRLILHCCNLIVLGKDRFSFAVSNRVGESKAVFCWCFFSAAPTFLGPKITANIARNQAATYSHQTRSKKGCLIVRQSQADERNCAAYEEVSSPLLTEIRWMADNSVHLNFSFALKLAEVDALANPSKWTVPSLPP